MRFQLSQIFLLIAAAAQLSTAFPVAPSKTVLVNPAAVDVLNATSSSTNCISATSIFKPHADSADKGSITVLSNIKIGSNSKATAQEVCQLKRQTPRHAQSKFRHANVVGEKISAWINGCNIHEVTAIRDTATPIPGIDIDGNKEPPKRDITTPASPGGRASSVEGKNADPARKLNILGRLILDLRRWAKYWNQRLASGTKNPPFDKDNAMIDIGKLGPEELSLLASVGLKEFKLLLGNATSFGAENRKRAGLLKRFKTWGVPKDIAKHDKIGRSDEREPASTMDSQDLIITIVHTKTPTRGCQQGGIARINRRTTATLDERSGQKEFWAKVAKAFDRVFAESHVKGNDTVGSKTPLSTRGTKAYLHAEILEIHPTSSVDPISANPMKKHTYEAGFPGAIQW